MTMKPSDNLPVVSDCNGCGVCCLHMGFPSFMLPKEKVTQQQIDSNPELQDLLLQGWTNEELLNGTDGESYWHSLPEDLRAEWLAFVENYQRAGPLDDACFWLDQETRLCKHHEHRPHVCRDFEIGSKICQQWRKHYKDIIK